MLEDKILKALQVCASEETECWECPYSVGASYCSTRLLNDTINLITKQKDEIKAMSEATTRQDEIIAKMQATQFEMANKGACQSKEIKRLESLCTAKDVIIEDQEAKIERLTEESKTNFDKWQILDDRTKEKYAELYEEAKDFVRGQAIKKFAERLRAKCHNYYPSIDSYCISRKVVLLNDIDSLVKEMTEVEDDA